MYIPKKEYYIDLHHFFFEEIYIYIM